MSSRQFVYPGRHQGAGLVCALPVMPSNEARTRIRFSAESSPRRQNKHDVIPDLTSRPGTPPGELPEKLPIQSPQTKTGEKIVFNLCLSVYV